MDYIADYIANLIVIDRLLSRLNLKIFTIHHCAMNPGCGGWFSFIIVCYCYVSGEAIYPAVWFKSR